jgi:hypothetical protein
MQDGEHVFTKFEPALVLGKYNEDVIAHEFAYQGIPAKRTEGKNNFDFILPNGQTLEWKIDIRSQCTGSGAIEYPTLKRGADYYGYTFTYARVFTHSELEYLYLHQSHLPAGGMGDAAYDGRLVRNMGKHGIPFYQFLRDLKQSH